MTAPLGPRPVQALAVLASSWLSVVLAAVLVRGAIVLPARELQVHAWALPTSVQWNGSELPFAYPPLALYLTGWVTSLGVDFGLVMRILPLVTSAAAALLVLAIGRHLLCSRPGSLAAALTYSFAHWTYSPRDAAQSAQLEGRLTLCR